MTIISGYLPVVEHTMTIISGYLPAAQHTMTIISGYLSTCRWAHNDDHLWLCTGCWAHNDDHLWLCTGCWAHDDDHLCLDAGRWAHSKLYMEVYFSFFSSKFQQAKVSLDWSLTQSIYNYVSKLPRISDCAGIRYVELTFSHRWGYIILGGHH